MKISIDKLRIHPKEDLVCYFGYDSEVKAWVKHHKLNMNVDGKYINIDLMGKPIEELFHIPEPYMFMDGFSPNMNKKLHVGHLSNLIMAQSLEKMGAVEQTVYMVNNVEGKDELYKAKIFDLMCFFDYHPDYYFYPDEVSYKGNLTVGKGKYENTMGVVIDDNYIVCVKSDGTTSYFFEDLKMADKFGETLYVTGKEQKEHFEALKKVKSNIEHLPMGHITFDGSKMSSRLGNVIYTDELFNAFEENFHCNSVEFIEIVKNILIGAILEKNPKTDKNINMKGLLDVKKSCGLYLSYTSARLFNAGMSSTSGQDDFNSSSLKLVWLKSRKTLNPSLFLNALMKLAKKINYHYDNGLKIKDNPEGIIFFTPLFEDLLMGFELLGLSPITKV
jgi:arginyl-tRNA synthetase